MPRDGKNPKINSEYLIVMGAVDVGSLGRRDRKDENLSQASTYRNLVE